MSHKPATIKEIAKRLNVSISTVSRALHDHPSIGLRTKMQVQKLAAEMNYEPNLTAVSFKQGKTMTLGVILPNLGEEFFSIAINGIEDVATKNKYTVLIGQSHDDVEREKQIVDTMRRHRVDGIIVSLAKTTKDYNHFQQLKNYNIPVVFFDRIPDLPDAYSVMCNLENSSVELVDWLVNKGHKQIGFIKGPDTIVQSAHRLQGYQQALKKHKIKPEASYIVTTDLTRKKTQDAMHKLLALKIRPTAVIAFNDYVALDAMQYARLQGIHINKDISFVSYANLPLTNYLDEPPVASVEQFPYQQAEKATSVLLQLINSRNNDPDIPQKTILESKVVVNKK
ncbi:MAG TPA: LacI family DNA-binding transcriptional regulator [Chitinophagaceae bacterium]|nr:LacI family DNA-binding transcriptional regulator [Chitinophagaceae bacterium]HRF18276.1 LacI family DNA-binding transcriptional regulator [Chitinophagaceae bacterium]